MFHEITRNPVCAVRKSVLTGGASTLAFAAVFAATPALAAPCGTVNVVTTPCDGQATPVSGDFTNSSIILAPTSDPIPAVKINSDVAINAFVNSGEIRGGATSLRNDGIIAALDNSGTISSIRSTNLIGDGVLVAINNGGTVTALENTGTIVGIRIGISNTKVFESIENKNSVVGRTTGFFNQAGAVTGNLINGAAATIQGNVTGVRNVGTINTLNNAGTISSNNTAIRNESGTVATLTNSGVIGVALYGIASSGAITQLVNEASGEINGTRAGISNTGSIGSLTNHALIKSTENSFVTSDGPAILNSGTITTLDNRGNLLGGRVALENGSAGNIANLINSGTIASDQIGIFNNGATLGTITNSGTITGTSDAGIFNSAGSIGTIANEVNGSIDGKVKGIYNTGTINALNNAGTISGGVSGIDNRGTIGTLTNSGTISSDSGGINHWAGAIGRLTNSGLISGGSTGIYSRRPIDTLTNSGTISGGNTGIFNDTTGAIGTLSNLGTINGDVLGIGNWGTISALRNFGTMGEIRNNGLIETLVNGQGGAGGGGTLAPLVLSGTMITGGYTAHFTSPTHYGQVVYTGGEGVLAAFGLTGESVLAKGTYQDVLAGIQTVNGPLTGTMGRYQWSLVADAATAGNWDLLVIRLGPDAVNSLLALGLSRDEIMTAMANRAARITNLLSSDCGSFGSAGLCLSAELRRLEHRDESETSMALSAGLRLTGNLRIGAFVDLPIHRKSRLTGLSTDQDTVSYGGFVGYSQKGDGSGIQARLVGAVHGQDVTITRAADLADTEAGRGQSRFKTWALAGELGYAFAVAPGNRIMPTIGLRHVRAARAAYAEAAASEVEFPFTYGAYGLRTTTAQAGVTAQGDLGGRLSYRVSTGVEWDLASRSDAFAGTSQVDDLSSFALSPAGSGRRFRGNGAVELGYEFTRGARITLGGALRGEAFTNQITTNLTAGIRIGF